MNGAAVHPGFISKTDEPPKQVGWGKMRALRKDHNLPKKPPSALVLALRPFQRAGARALAFVNTLAIQFLLYCFYVFLFQALIAAVRVKEEVYLASVRPLTSLPLASGAHDAERSAARASGAVPCSHPLINTLRTTELLYLVSHRAEGVAKSAQQLQSTQARIIKAAACSQPVGRAGSRSSRRDKMNGAAVHPVIRTRP